MAVYFREALGANCIKIGWSRRVLARAGNRYATDCPVPLVLLKVIEGGREVEREWKYRFRHLHVHGEWYDADEELREAIERVEAAPGIDLNEGVRKRIRSSLPHSPTSEMKASSGRPRGRPRINAAAPMSAAERTRRYRERKRAAMLNTKSREEGGDQR